MPFENLTDENIMLYAAKAYDMPNCVMSEFTEDMKRLNYLKRLFRRYSKHGEMRERLILNHIVVLYNIFGAEASTRILFYNTSKDDYSILKTYLLFLNLMPEKVRGINGKDVLSSDISVDMKITEVLRNLQ